MVRMRRRLDLRGKQRSPYLFYFAVDSSQQFPFSGDPIGGFIPLNAEGPSVLTDKVGT